MFWRLLYNMLVIPLGWIGFQILGLVNHKARRGLRGRKDLFPNLQTQVARLNRHSKRIWFHSSSMGEFEQAKPIIAELKRTHPTVDIIVSFFSPSGFEHSLNYKLATIITYLPFDSRANAEQFIDLIKPTAAIVVRYDLWPNHIWALHDRGIPIYMASATLRDTTARKLPLLFQFHRALYDCLNYILTVSETDKAVFESFRLQRPVLNVIGDTRYDQVKQRSNESRMKHLLPPGVIEHKKLLLIGSSWEEDERHVLPACFELLGKHANVLIVLVPHEPNEENLERVENLLNGHATHLRLSELNDYRQEQFLIIDSVGILMALYQYAHVAFVGGSFGEGVHNVLEPAVYGVPIVFGPNYENSQEAVQLLKERGAYVANTANELLKHLDRLFTDSAERDKAGRHAKSLVERNTGATMRVLSYLEKVL